MPVIVEKITSGKNKGKYRVKHDGVSAEATTKVKAERQQRLLNAIAYNPDFKPRRG